MPWKADYTISDEIALADGKIIWPAGVRCAVTVVVALSTATGPEGMGPHDLSGAEAELAFGTGLDALLEMLDRFGIQGTFAVPAVIAAIAPCTVRRLVDAGHEIAALGFRHEDPSDLSREDEFERIKATIQAIEDAAGVRPAGWYALPRQRDRYAAGTVSQNTVDLLIDAGFAYLGNGMADDAPHYWVTDPSGPRSLLTMPYSYHFDDQFFLLFPPAVHGSGGSGLEHPEVLASNWRTEFAAQRNGGGMFTMTLHPHIIGCLHRIRLLEDFFASVKAHDDVWIATAKQCAEHWLAHHNPETHLRLAPSIWRDYHDSLS